MLKSVDILIGFSLIMLVVSMSVTLIIQWIVNISGMRGAELLKGLTALLTKIDPSLKEHAEAIAKTILTDPMLAHTGEKLAGVVQREELIMTVLHIAAGAVSPSAAPVVGSNAAPSTAPPAPTNVSPAEQALAKALANLGIPDPGKKLDAIRLLSMRLEASQPELATHVREAQAVITEAESQFVAKVNGWFDSTMDRVSQSFTKRSRFWTVVVSLFLALLLQIDTFKIVNRLAMDDNLRAKLVEAAAKTAPTPPPAPTPPDLKDATQANLTQLTSLATETLITWPDNLDHWLKNWAQSSVFGVLLSAGLLSLGAPFWFNALGDLLKLRPMLASKDDQQRQDRESSQTPPDGGSSPPLSLAASASGERGDLSAG